MKRILFVDDEVNILSGIRRNLRRHFDVFTAEGGEAGLEMIETEGPFAVVVSDYRMPGMDGVQFLAKVRETSPQSVRMMLTGQAEMNAVIGAINSSKIFRFLPKPISRDELIAALDDALEQYRLVTAEKQLLEQTLSSSVKALVDLLGMVNPVAFSRAARIKRCVAWLVGRLQPPDPWEFELAGLLSQVGCATIPAETLQKVFAGQEVSEDEAEMVAHHPRTSYFLLREIPRLERVAAMIACQNDPSNLVEPYTEDEAVRLGAGLIRVAARFDDLVSRGLTPKLAIAELAGADPPFPEEHLALLREYDASEEQSMTVRAVNLRDLAPGMVLDEDVLAVNGVVVISRGQEVTGALIMRLKNFDKGMGIKQPFRVRVPCFTSVTPGEE
ncbi:MAG: response regulator [Acidobacteriota bacterium]|nr:response regulator [Acidobacteriota bacterium]